MKLITVGSGSDGNCYLLKCGEEILVLDAGIPFICVKKALRFNIMGIQAVLITHSHGDHVKFAHEYEAAGITVWKPYEDDKLRQDAQFGSFRVQSVPMVHNVPCVGYLIHHPDMGKMLYATDTEYIKYRFRGLNVALIEANYADEFIDRTAVKFRHVLTGHLNITTTAEFIRTNATNLNHVILCHMSNDGSDPVAFRQEIEAVVPSECTVHIAEPGTELDVSAIPF